MTAFAFGHTRGSKITGSKSISLINSNLLLPKRWKQNGHNVLFCPANYSGQRNLHITFFTKYVQYS